jgi:hypothetical protein
MPPSVLSAAKSHVWTSIALLAALWAPVSHVAAQRGANKASHSAEYKKTIDEALKEYELGHWDEAAALFGRAHELNPNARTLRGMGLAAFENRKYTLALTQLQAALTDTRNPLSASQREQVKAVIGRASIFVASVQLRLSPEDLELKLDGAVIARPESGELLLDPGDYLVSGSAPGYKSANVRIKAEGGTHKQVDLDLEREPEHEVAETKPEAASHAVAEAPDSAVEAAPTTSSGGGGGAGKALAYTGFIVGGAALVAGSITGVLTLSKASTLKKQCPNDACPPGQSAALHNADTLATVSNIAFGVAAAGLIAGVIGLVMQGHGASEPASESAAAALTVQPVLGIDGVGVSGRF